MAAGVFGTIKFQANTRRPQLEALAARLTALAKEAAERGLAWAQGIQADEGSSTTEFTARVNSFHSARCRSSALDPSSVRVK